MIITLPTKITSRSKTNSKVDKISVVADVHGHLPPKGPHHIDESTGLPYGYENILPKTRAKLDEKAFVSTIVYDKTSYYTDTSTTTMTSTTSDDLVSTSDEDERGDNRNRRPKRRQLR